MRNHITLAIFAVILAGCATAYQRQSFTGGFSETQLGENIFQVSFKGNAYTSRERASDFTLLRQNAPPGRAGMNGEESPPKL